MPTPLVTFSNVTKRFGDKTILDGISLSINAGEVTTIIGKSGVGKSVFLKHIIGLLSPDSGEISFMGRPLASLGPKERQQMKRECSYMFQHNALFDSLTVFENIALPLREKTRLSPQEIQERVKARMDDLELGEVGHKYPTQLSGGMQKRVALARALINDPKIVLFDEPTTGLDPIRKNAVLSMIAHYQERFNFSAVLVSHDIPDVFYISDRVAIIDNAKVIFQGTPLELEHTHQPVINGFINSLDMLKDDLTGLCTFTRLSRAFDRAQKDLAAAGTPFSVVVLHVRGLDDISSRIGSIATHTVLEHFARKWQAVFSKQTPMARYPYGKVVGILPGVSLEGAEGMATAIAQTPRNSHTMAIPGYTGEDVTADLMAGSIQGCPETSLEKHIAAGSSRPTVISAVACTGARP
ncbi:ATP-binding cassette domain-containing protein [Desulfoplanes sp.]